MPVQRVVSGPFRLSELCEVKSQLERDIQSVGDHLAHLTLRKKNDDAQFQSFFSQLVSKFGDLFQRVPCAVHRRWESVVRRLQ